MASAFEFPPLDRFFDNTLLDPVVAQRELAAFARRERDALISSGQASPSYETYVNERQGAAEETVIMPGPITYIFSNWKLVIETALAELQKRAPRRGGKYAASFLVTVGGRVVTDYMSIAPDATVIIINAQPYTRKMEVGANKTGARHFELSKSAINRRFGRAFSATFTFMNAASGIDPRVPYILKRPNGRRKDSQAGMPITYPAIEINAV